MTNKVPIEGMQAITLQILDPSGDPFTMSHLGFSAPALPVSYRDPTLDKNTYWGPALGGGPS